MCCQCACTDQVSLFDPLYFLATQTARFGGASLRGIRGSTCFLARHLQQRRNCRGTHYTAHTHKHTHAHTHTCASTHTNTHTNARTNTNTRARTTGLGTYTSILYSLYNGTHMHFIYTNNNTDIRYHNCVHNRPLCNVLYPHSKIWRCKRRCNYNDIPDRCNYSDIPLYRPALTISHGTHSCT